MGLKEDKNNPGLREGDDILGNIVQRVVELKEINSFLYLLEHNGTGAKHIHISNKDKENTFSVCFKTVPADSTGVAHILEHTVLCGSKKFPVRDPFFSMLKRSLSTFMNAFTASDWTMYPFSTQNRKDFYNLMGVYLDAVFFPRLDELSFRQEGHRLELEVIGDRPDSNRLAYTGIVYNEMKGKMSTPDEVMVQSLLTAMYPDTTYRYNSGGDPYYIPKLTYDQFQQFHKQNYHPSNAFFYTYGNMPLKDHLSFIQERTFQNFNQIRPAISVPTQPRWDNPRTATYPYPLDKNMDPSKKYQACVGWLTADVKDSFEVLVLTVLEQILLGNAASPLRKTLMDSGLGSALCAGTGLDDNNRDMLFACGLKDVEKSAPEKVNILIFDTLHSLVKKGIDKDLVESAIHQIEFHRKEITNTPYPYGLKLLLMFAGSWFHGGKPENILKIDADLEKLRLFLSKGPFLEENIKRYFLDNPHRILLTLVPDQQMETKEAERIAAELERMKAGLGSEDLEKIKENSKALQKRQEAVEDVSCLPTLELEDIPPGVQTIAETKSLKNVSAVAVSYDQPTSGIFYLSAVAPITNLEKSLIPMAPFFCYALPKVGTKIHDYVEIARLINLYTGGFDFSALARTRGDETGHCMPLISLNTKCLTRNRDRMIDLVEELMDKCSFSNITRIKQLLLEYRAGMESGILYNGHRLAISLASRNHTYSSALSEIWDGVHQLKFIKRIVDEISEEKLKNISDDLTRIAKSVFAQSNLTFALIGETENLSYSETRLAESQLFSTLARRPQSAYDSGLLEIEIGDNVPWEGWTTSSSVSFVAQTFITVRMGHEDAPALAVIAKIIFTSYLHKEVREKGGAYGGYALYNLESGLFSLASFRDPHITATLNTYDKTAAFIQSDKINEQDIKEAILQVCSDIDKPDPPGPAARKAFHRKIISLTDEDRNRFKQKLLALDRKQIRRVADKYFGSSDNKLAVAVITSGELLERANKKLTKPLQHFLI